MRQRSKIENRILENPSFWIIIVTISITILLIIIRYGWDISDDGYVNDLWHFSLGIFFAAFFTAALTYVGILFQGKLQKDLQIEELNNNYIQELSKERKIQLFEELLNLAIDFEYQEESLEDYKKIEVILFKIRMYCNDATIAAAQKMIDVVTQTAHGAGKEEIEDFAIACNKELYFKYDEKEQKDIVLTSFATYLFNIQKRILKVDKNIVFIELPSFDNRDYLWQLTRFNSQFLVTKDNNIFKFSKDSHDKNAQKDGAIEGIEIGSILIFYAVYRSGKAIPGIIGIAKVLEINGNLITLDWIVSTNTANRVKLNYERYNLKLPNPEKNIILNSEIKPENLQSLYDLETDLKLKNKQKLKILKNKELTGKKTYNYISIENADDAIEFLLIALQNQGSIIFQIDGTEYVYEGILSDIDIVEINIEKLENKSYNLKIKIPELQKVNYKIKLDSRHEPKKDITEYYMIINSTA